MTAVSCRLPALAATAGFITLLTSKHVAAYIIVDRALNVLFSGPVFNRIIADMDCVEIRGKYFNLYAWEFYKKGVALIFSNGHENSPTLIRLMALYNLPKGEALCAMMITSHPWRGYRIYFRGAGI